MSSNLTIPLFRVAGVPIRVHLFLPLLLVLYVVTTPSWTRPENLVPVLVWFAVLLVSTLLHEAGHAAAARRDGLAVHEIRLSILAGLTLHEPARSTGSEIRVALAGIAVNLVLALAAGAAILASTGRMPGVPGLAVTPGWLECVWGTNLFLAGFNLLPGIPLDGGHAAEALLARRFGRTRAKMAVLSSGLLIAATLLVLGLTGQHLMFSVLGGAFLMTVLAEWRALREAPQDDGPLLGTYDFSNGYTSLEKGPPKAPPRESRAEIRRREREKADAEAREAAVAREAHDSKARLDRLLDRIAADGISSLTTEERAFLNEQSRRLRDRVKR